MEFLLSSHKPPLFVELEAIANDTSLVDNHAHPLYEYLESSSRYQTIPRLETILTEATSVRPNAPIITARSTLTLSRSVRDMQTLLGSTHIHPLRSHSTGFGTNSLMCASKEETEVEQKRESLGLYALALVSINSAKISAVLIDDGISHPPDASPISYMDFQNKLNISIARRILRLETEAEIVLSEIFSSDEFSKWKRSGSCPKPKPNQEDFKHLASSFLEAFRSRLNPLPKDVVSFKSVAAYRSTLEIKLEHTEEELGRALHDLLFSKPWSSSPVNCVRLTCPIVIDFVFKEGLDAARIHDIPIQIHCGFGDTDVDIVKANPSLLRSVFHAYPDVKLVLLHAAWPYVHEAAFLSSTYPSVYVDISLVVPLLSVRGMFKAIDSLFDIAPINKILYGSDAHSCPDVFYLAALWGRKVITAITTASILTGDLTVDEAKTAIRSILADNSLNLYKLRKEESSSGEP